MPGVFFMLGAPTVTVEGVQATPATQLTVAKQVTQLTAATQETQLTASTQVTQLTAPGQEPIP
ncbi:MAG: hypothetical protein V3W06_09175 [Acidimicrobiia bacterium]